MVVGARAEAGCVKNDWGCETAGVIGALRQEEEEEGEGSDLKGGR